MNVGVFGLGSVLMSDDGVGPSVVHRLAAACDFPPGVELLDLGTPGPHLHPHFENRDAVILIDTVRADGEAGEVRLYRRHDLAAGGGPRVGPHDPGLGEALATLEVLGQAPEFLLIGVIPARLEAGTELSPEVERALPAIEGQVLAELERLGFEATPRAEPREPDLWWMRQ